MCRRTDTNCLSHTHTYTPVWPHTHTLYPLIAWDWWGDQWPIPVHLRWEYWLTMGCRVTFKDLVNQQGLLKLFWSKCHHRHIKFKPRETILLRLRQYLETFPKIVGFGVFSVTPLLAPYCYCIFVCICTFEFQCDSFVLSVAKHKGPSPLLQGDDITSCDALPWQQVCVVNDSWTAGVCMTWVAFKPTLLWHYLSSLSV